MYYNQFLFWRPIVGGKDIGVAGGSLRVLNTPDGAQELHLTVLGGPYVVSGIKLGYV